MSNKEFFLIKKSNDYYLYDESKNWAIGSSNDRQRTPNGHKLSVENCNEISGVVDVEKLAEETIGELFFEVKALHIELFKKGFNKAMELNKDKLFNVEDLIKIFFIGRESLDKAIFTVEEAREKIFSSLQQPKEIEVEIEMELVSDGLDEMAQPQHKKVPKLDENGCVILIKKI